VVAAFNVNIFHISVASSNLVMIVIELITRCSFIVCLLDCDTVMSCRWISTFRRNMPPPSLGSNCIKRGVVDLYTWLVKVYYPVPDENFSPKEVSKGNPVTGRGGP
jgi:hypothetical protein